MNLLLNGVSDCDLVVGSDTLEGALSASQYDVYGKDNARRRAGVDVWRDEKSVRYRKLGGGEGMRVDEGQDAVRV